MVATGSMHRQTNNGLLRELRSHASMIAQEVRHQAKEVGQLIQEEANRAVQKRKGRTAFRLHDASALARKTGKFLRAGNIDSAAHYVDAAAGYVERAGSYLEDHDLGEMLDDAGDVIKRYPIAALSTLVLVGLGAGRFLLAAAEELASQSGERASAKRRKGRKAKSQQR